MTYRLGVDVGGTFTDLFLVSEGNGGAQFRVKTPSTPHDPSEGVLTGVRRICGRITRSTSAMASRPIFRSLVSVMPSNSSRSDP